MEFLRNDRGDDEGVDTLCLAAVGTDITVMSRFIIRIGNGLCKGIAGGMDIL